VQFLARADRPLRRLVGNIGRRPGLLLPPRKDEHVPPDRANERPVLRRNIAERFFEQVRGNAVCARVAAGEDGIDRLLRRPRVGRVRREVHDRLHEREDARKHRPVVALVERAVGRARARDPDAKRDPEVPHGILRLEPSITRSYALRRPATPLA
jgi:hypothetical protein